MTTHTFGTVLALPDRSELSALVECENTNRWGKWFDVTGGPDGLFPSTFNGYCQFLSGDSMGWHGTTLKVYKGQAVRTTGAKRLDKPWYDPETGKWRRGWLRYAETVMGAYQDEVWPKEDALRIKTDRSRLWVKVTGSPSRCLYVEGDYNDVTVDVEQGEQSNNIQDLAAVYFLGKGNVLRGVSRGQLCAAFFNGPDNRTLDFTAYVRGIGADRGGVYWKKFSHRFKATNTTVHMGEREFPATHGEQGFYGDDEASDAVLYNCASYGAFTRGVFIHGGSNNRVERFRSFGPATPVEFAPHFLKPTVQPTGNVQLSVTTTL